MAVDDPDEAAEFAEDERSRRWVEALDAALRGAGYTQKQIAEATGISRTSMHRYVHGRVPRDADHVLSLELFLRDRTVDYTPGTLWRIALTNRPRPPELATSEESDDLPDEEPEPASHQGPQLPIRLTSFIGREKDLVRLRELLPRSRLLTITGTGGVGKTRLALQLAGSLVADYQGAVYFAKLETINDGDLIPKAVASALDVQEETGTALISVIRRTIDERDRTLLVLDNCEHVIEAAAAFVASALHSCPALTVLATSRQSLAVEGETEYPLGPLAIPTAVGAMPETLADIESVVLFIDRARNANADFALTADNADDVADLCRDLDGIPLAIELAAARCNALPPRQIGERLHNRLDTLRSADRLATARHQTLEETIRWSHALLSDAEREVFAQLSVFEGAFTMEAAEAIAGCDDDPHTVFDAVVELVAKSLLARREGPDGRARYRMLNTIRQFARARLDESGDREAVADRYAHYYVALARRFAPHIRGSRPSEAHDILDQAYDNVIGALRAELGRGHVDAAIELATSLTWFWYWRGRAIEGDQWTTRVIDASTGAPHEMQARLLYGGSLMSNIVGDLDRAEARMAKSLHIAQTLESPTLVAQALTGLGVIAKDRGDLLAAQTHFHNSIELDRPAGRGDHLATTMRFAGEIAYLRGDLRAAGQNLGEAIELFGTHGDSGGGAWALAHLGELRRRERRLPEAEELLTDAEAAHRNLGHDRGLAWTGVFQSLLARDLERPSEALARLRTAEGRFRLIGDRRGLPYALLPQISLARNAGDLPTARALIAEARDVGSSVGDQRIVTWVLLEEAHTLAAEGEPAEEALFEALERMSSIGDSQGFGFALELAARMAWQRSDYSRALALFGAAAVRVGDEELKSTLDRRASEVGVAVAEQWEAGRACHADDAIRLARGV